MIGRRTGLWLVGFVMLISNWVSAQSFAETALLFSRTQPNGSARIQGIGGTQISLGGDYSSALSNPAGLGMYNRSEFAITPAFNMATASADYMGTSTSDSKNTFHIPRLGTAFHSDYGKLSGFLGGTFSIAYGRINDFNQNISYEGTNPNNSIIDYFIEDATGRTPDEQFNNPGYLLNTPTHLGYENYLIGDSTVFDVNANPTAYFTDVLGIPFQSEQIQTRGAQNQWSFSYGVNYNDKLFLGAGIGVNTLRYKSIKTYSEAFQNEPLSDLTLEETLEIRGSGINATMGAIFRPVDGVQIGLAATTPTHYELSDTYSAVMRTNWNNFQYDPSTTLTNEQFASEILTSDYSLNTPWKLSAGATYFLGKNGFISLDVERTNYAKAKYNSITSDISYDADNQDIRSLYQPVYNLRGGVEYRLNSFRVRGGYSYLPQPFKTKQNNVSEAIERISTGFGYREKNFYIDLALVYSQGNKSYRPYTINTVNSPLVTYKQSSTNVLVTVGFPL